VALSSISYNDQHVFSVESNSSLSLLSYNGTTKSLSFSATGQAGTRGYARIMVAKSLINDSSRVGVYVEDAEKGFRMMSPRALLF
jgi:hypothetical protein